MPNRINPEVAYNPTEKTLAEQMQITEREIQSRMDLLNFTQKDAQTLKALGPKVGENLETIVEAFYDKQLQTREIALVIGDAETLDRLRTAMRRYILELFDGYYDSEYVNKRLRIGKIHQRIGVSPKLYVSALTLLEKTIIGFLLVHDKSDSTIRCGECEEQRSAVHKLMMFDMQLVFDTYISSLVNEVETAKSELEEYAESLEKTVAIRTQQLQDMATQDSLTGLFNQRGFYDHLHREISVSERTKTPLTLIYFDLNRFKLINDTKGHTEGDTLLTLVGLSVSSAIRDVDFGCRYGGDEFCIIMPRSKLENAKILVQRLVDIFDKGQTHGVTFSVGLAQTGPDTFLHSDELIKVADQLMYKAKARSKDNPGHHCEPNL